MASCAAVSWLWWKSCGGLSVVKWEWQAGQTRWWWWVGCCETPSGCRMGAAFRQCEGFLSAATRLLFFTCTSHAPTSFFCPVFNTLAMLSNTLNSCKMLLWIRKWLGRLHVANWLWDQNQTLHNGLEGYSWANWAEVPATLWHHLNFSRAHNSGFGSET